LDPWELDPWQLPPPLLSLGESVRFLPPSLRQIEFVTFTRRTVFVALAQMELTMAGNAGGVAAAAGTVTTRTPPINAATLAAATARLRRNIAPPAWRESSR
jgi:hypothetical protein